MKGGGTAVGKREGKRKHHRKGTGFPQLGTKFENTRNNPVTSTFKYVSFSIRVSTWFHYYDEDLNTLATLLSFVFNKSAGEVNIPRK